MNESDESTTEDSSDCGDETSTYAGRDQDTHVPEPPNSQDELDYLVCLVSSSEKEDKQEFSKLVNLAESSQKPSIKTPSSGMKKTPDLNAVDAILAQKDAIDHWSKKKQVIL